MEINGFEELAQKLREQGEVFEERVGGGVGTTRTTGIDPDSNRFTSAKTAIQAGVSDTMDEHVVPQARTEARQHVPTGHAKTIDHDGGEWTGSSYRHQFFSTSDLVKYHEFGTSTKAQDTSRATIDTFDNGERGYRIPSPPGKAAIPADEWNGPSWMIYTEGDGKDAVIFDYVVHPGVPAQKFMQDALEENMPFIKDKVEEKLERIDLELR